MKFLFIILGLFFASQLSAMQPAASTKNPDEKFKGKKIDFYRSVSLGKDANLEIHCDRSKKLFYITKHWRNWWGDLKQEDLLTYPIMPELINIRSLGMRTLFKNEFLGAVITTVLEKDGEFFRKKDTCVLAKYDDSKHTTSMLTHPIEGKSIKVKFKISDDEKINAVYYSHNGDHIIKMSRILDVATFKDVQEKTVRWKRVQE